jgi:hypothetical protein
VLGGLAEGLGRFATGMGNGHDRFITITRNTLQLFANTNNTRYLRLSRSKSKPIIEM